VLRVGLKIQVAVVRGLCVPVAASLLLCVAVAGCTPEPGEPRERIIVGAATGIDQLFPLLNRTIVKEDSNHLIGNPTQVAYSPWSVLHIADLSMREVKAFGPDGGFIGVLGRSGSGPGEYNAPVDVAYAREPDRVSVLDVSRERVLVFARDSLLASDTREVVSRLLPSSVLLLTGDSLLMLGVNREYATPGPREVAWVDERDSVVRYLLPRPREQNRKGIVVNISASIGATTERFLYFAHKLHPVLYRFDRAGEQVDSVRLPKELLSVAELPDTVPTGQLGMRTLMRSLDFISRVVAVDDSTFVISVRVFDARADEIRFRLGLLEWGDMVHWRISEVCDCRLAGVVGDTVVVFGGGPPDSYFFERRGLRSAAADE
jgi:hypothetical protein